ncbi:MAG: Uma2 family endonuclease [Actinomycetota bacterium]|nr:Uma2 family endonuclease [Actinomycetota bacterium]
MDVVRQQVGAEELLHMPDDGFRYELVRGELRQMTPAGNVHGRVAVGSDEVPRFELAVREIFG